MLSVDPKQANRTSVTVGEADQVQQLLMVSVRPELEKDGSGCGLMVVEWTG